MVERFKVDASIRYNGDNAALRNTVVLKDSNCFDEVHFSDIELADRVAYLLNKYGMKD